MPLMSGTMPDPRCDAELIQSERILREENRRLRESLRLARIQATRAERAMLEGQGMAYFYGAHKAADRTASSLRHVANAVHWFRQSAREFLACL